MRELYPIFLKLDAKPVLIAGGGAVALGKVRSLLVCGARLTVVAPELLADLIALSEERRFVVQQRAFVESDLDGQVLVFAATADRAVNRQVIDAARRRGVLANSVDDPELCEFYSAAVLRRGPVQVAVGTSGEFPGLARAFREQLDLLIPRECADAGRVVAELRTAVRAAPLATSRRRRALGELVAWFTQEYLTPQIKESP